MRFALRFFRALVMIFGIPPSVLMASIALNNDFDTGGWVYQCGYLFTWPGFVSLVSLFVLIVLSVISAFTGED